MRKLSTLWRILMLAYLVRGQEEKKEVEYNCTSGDPLDKSLSLKTSNSLHHFSIQATEGEGQGGVVKVEIRSKDKVNFKGFFLRAIPIKGGGHEEEHPIGDWSLGNEEFNPVSCGISGGRKKGYTSVSLSWKKPNRESRDVIFIGTILVGKTYWRGIQSEALSHSTTPTTTITQSEVTTDEDTTLQTSIGSSTDVTEGSSSTDKSNSKGFWEGRSVSPSGISTQGLSIPSKAMGTASVWWIHHSLASFLLCILLHTHL